MNDPKPNVLALLPAVPLVLDEFQSLKGGVYSLWCPVPPSLNSIGLTPENWTEAVLAYSLASGFRPDGKIDHTVTGRLRGVGQGAEIRHADTPVFTV